MENAWFSFTELSPGDGSRGGLGEPTGVEERTDLGASTGAVAVTGFVKPSLALSTLTPGAGQVGWKDSAGPEAAGKAGSEGMTDGVPWAPEVKFAAAAAP